MSAWFASNWGTILVGLLLLALVAAILRSLIGDRKKGVGGCGCGCSGCPHSAQCHPKSGE